MVCVVTGSVLTEFGGFFRGERKTLSAPLRSDGNQGRTPKWCI